MQRRNFLKASAIGLGSIGTIRGGFFKAWAQTAPLPDAAGPYNFAEMAESRGLTWGVNSVALKAPWKDTPSRDALLADGQRTLSLDRFHRVGSDSRPATATEFRMAYTGSALLVLFRCTESDMSFPYTNLDPSLWSNANWFSMAGLPSGAVSSWPPYPDEVDILIQPDADEGTIFQFAATPQGEKFACKRMLGLPTDFSADEAAGGKPPVRSQEIKAFEATITKTAKEWIALFQIPWQTLGGMPKSGFGFLPMRTRWRDGEFSSPVAMDFNEFLPIDLLIQANFAEDGKDTASRTSLCRLPSGMLRWQAPAQPTYPDAETLQGIWKMQASLATPTDDGNLAQRLYLTQRWMDLMTLEGFTPLRTGWGLLTTDLTLPFIRQRINAAFQRNAPEHAHRLLDGYLRQLDEMSRWWFADGSPGNLFADAWTALTEAEILKLEQNTLSMQCLAGSHRFDLRLSLPATGGVRLYHGDGGYWRPTELAPMAIERTPGTWSVRAGTGTIQIAQKPFSISFRNAAGMETMRIEGRDLSFRFGPDGQILATDFRLRLAPDEVIYGFGEQYNRFNQNGHVLTLWGTDDSIGNGKGLANATYKPLPIFHSSRPYMLFNNSSYRLRADVGRADPTQCRLTQHGPIFDCYVWMDAPEQALRSYTALTGRPPLPPKWAFEPWMGRGGGAWADGRLKDSLDWITGELADAVSEEESAIRRFAELDIPHSAIYAEGPSALSEELNRFLAPRNIHTLGYFRPEIGPARQKLLMPELKPEELPILHCGSQSQTEILGYVDFTHPNARELCRRALAPAFARGGAGSMVDFGDWVPDNAVFHDGRRGPEMHNAYFYDYHRTVSDVFRERRADDFILYARGAAPGTQRWVGQFAGDHPSNFDGIKHVLTGAMNLCACGYSTWGSDIGGYFGFPQPAVYMRWVQLGCFSPLMRPHGIAPREPWHFGPAAIANYKFLAWTRENLLNYIHNCATIARDTGLPIMRSMPIAFPHAPDVAAIGDQFLFGPDLLVAPVTDEREVRDIAFPSGTWTSLWDGKTVRGPVTRRIAAPLDIIPVYLKAGAAMPVQLNRELRFGGSMRAGRVDAVVVTPPDENGVVSLLNRQGERARITAEIGDGSVRWTLESLPEMEYLLIYGATDSTAVRIDGKPLPRISKPGNAQPGWEADNSLNRLIVRVPPQGKRSNPALRIEVDLPPRTKP